MSKHGAAPPYCTVSKAKMTVEEPVNSIRFSWLHWHVFFSHVGILPLRKSGPSLYAFLPFPIFPEVHCSTVFWIILIRRILALLFACIGTSGLEIYWASLKNGTRTSTGRFHSFSAGKPWMPAYEGGKTTH